MAVIQLTDFAANKVTALMFNDFVGIGSASIPQQTASPIGWYRIAEIDRTGLSNAPYPQIFLMTGGNYASGIPTMASLVASLPLYSSGSKARLTQLSGGGDLPNNYTQIRFGGTGTRFFIDVYQANSGSGARGKQEFFIAEVGGRLKTYSPYAVTDDPDTVYLTYTFKTTTTGAVTVS